MQGKSESKIGQQDRQDHVIQPTKKLLGERVREHVTMMGKGSYLLNIRYCPILSGTCVLRGLVGVCGV
jgi:hypothetical protein